MKLTINHYNGTDINDGTNYTAYFPQGSIFLQPGTDAVELTRSNNDPFYAGQNIPAGHTINLCVIMRGTIYSQIDDLRALINTCDENLRLLTATDESSVEWGIWVKPVGTPQFDGSMMTFTLSVSSLFWEVVTGATDSWSITSTGSTKDITNTGHLNCPPIFEITPGSSGGHGLGYSIFSQVRNRTARTYTKYPLDIASAGFDSASLLKVSTVHVQVNNGAGINDTVTTIPYETEVGTFPSSGTAMLESEQITYTGKSGGNLTGVTRGVNGTTAASHADNTIIYKSLVRFDGNDVRVKVDGVEVNRWFGSWNTANSKIFVNINLIPKVELTLDTAWADTGTPDFVFKKTAANKASLQRLPPTGMLLVGTELCAYDSIDIAKYTISTGTRAIKGTTAATHASGVTVYFIEHDIEIGYGGLTMEAPVIDNTVQPIFELDASSNTSWHYHIFMDYDLLRSGIWLPSIVDTNNTTDSDNETTFYTAHEYTDADPASAMGMSLQSFLKNSLWQAENGKVVWSFYNPSGVTTVAAAGEKYRHSTSWASKCGLLKSNDGKTWSTAWTTEATPASADTWTAWTQAGAALGATYNYLQFNLSGSISASANNLNHYNVDAGMTLTLDSNAVPLVTLYTAGANYHLQCAITNNETGDAIYIDQFMALNSTLLVDCKNKAVYNPDGTRADKCITFSSVRQNWIDFIPGANTIQFDDVGTVGITLETTLSARNP